MTAYRCTISGDTSGGHAVIALCEAAYCSNAYHTRSAANIVLFNFENHVRHRITDLASVSITVVIGICTGCSQQPARLNSPEIDAEVAAALAIETFDPDRNGIRCRVRQMPWLKVRRINHRPTAAWNHGRGNQAQEFGSGKQRRLAGFR